MRWLPAGSQVQCLRLPLVVAYPAASLLWCLQAGSVRTLAVMLMLTNVGPWTVMSGKQAGRRCDLCGCGRATVLLCTVMSVVS